ncbi:F-box/WD repeat-containing protein 12 isoform X2 [Talpa occidentalis]|uniref:F-box/WD repeat-containing protein 12 isoform X2 n=1 Tax=Talpa occidentalis TaxID=50954 RepID=UPI0023F94C6E|nr:F-box/WD repeat-containing protein 12 isoform X2 [Talpa occidentalis]
MEIQLPEVPLLRIFSFLDVYSLLQVSQVNRYWNEVAATDSLWRNLCLRKWRFCNFSYQCQGTKTWKQFFLTQTMQERRMALAQPEDFNCKEAKGDLGILGPMAYLSGSGHTMDGQEKSVICTVSSKRMLYAWDVQNGTMIWSSPVQKSRIMNLTTLPQMHLAFTADLEGTIKVWNCQYEDALAALDMPRANFSLEACLTKYGPFLMVANAEGDIYTLTVPELRSVSKVNAFKYSVDFLHFSPDKNWLFACGTYQNILPRVFFTKCLLRPSEDYAPLSLSLPLSSCCRACWAPRRPNRITLMFRRDSFKKTGFTTFDLTAVKNGDSIVLQAHMENPIWMGVSDGNMIAFESGPYLLLFTINGLMLQQFENHQGTIGYLWADSVHVLTTSMDDSLHIYMWEEEGRYPYLKSCCHLAQKQNDKTPSCYVSKAICDNVSIVCIVSRIRGSSILVMYSLKM